MRSCGSAAPHFMADVPFGNVSTAPISRTRQINPPEGGISPGSAGIRDPFHDLLLAGRSVCRAALPAHRRQRRGSRWCMAAPGEGKCDGRDGYSIERLSLCVPTPQCAAPATHRSRRQIDEIIGEARCGAFAMNVLQTRSTGSRPARRWFACESPSGPRLTCCDHGVAAGKRRPA